MGDTDVSKSYLATSVEEQQDAYDAWAEKYEPDLCSMGYRIPAVIAAVFSRHVPPDATPILDAGCGGGIQSEALSLLGYSGITGIDLSTGMLAIASDKNIYADLRQMTLGDPLDFPDNIFSAVISAGTITPNHAPPESFIELIRVAAPGAPIIFSLRDDLKQEPAYPEMLKRLEEQGAWNRAFQTPSFRSMPYGEPDITHRVHVFHAS